MRLEGKNRNFMKPKKGLGTAHKDPKHHTWSDWTGESQLLFFFKKNECRQKMGKTGAFSTNPGFSY